MYATHRVTLAVFATLATMGCGTSQGGTTQPMVNELDQYFVGTQVIRLPDGSERAGGSVVAHHERRPNERTVMEEVVIRDTNGAVESRAMLLEIDASDSHFTVRPIEGGDVAGEGDFTGEPWNWTARHIQTQLADGTMVVTDDVLSATDLSSEARVVGADGTTAMVIRQVLTRVSRERYEQERDAIQIREAAGQDRP